jgi:protein FRG1
VVVSSLDAGEEEGPSDVHHVFVCTRIPDTNDKVTFRSGTQKFLAADEYGAVTADREARGLQEEWTLEETQVPGRLAVKSSYGKFLSVDVVAGGKVELRADADEEGEGERWKVLMQGEFVSKAKQQFNARNGIKTRDSGDGLTIVTDLAGAEVDAMYVFISSFFSSRLLTVSSFASKRFHHHATGSDLVGTSEDRRVLKKAVRPVPPFLLSPS